MVLHIFSLFLWLAVRQFAGGNNIIAAEGVILTCASKTRPVLDKSSWLQITKPGLTSYKEFNT